MASVLYIQAREIIDSRGIPTLEVDVTTENGTHRASVPSGTTLSTKEPVDLRDHDATRFHGLGVQKAVSLVQEKISFALEGALVEDQHTIDKILRELDGTSNFSNLGGNTTLGVSMAIARAGAASKKVPLFQHIAQLAGKVILQLPVPVFTMINGGISSEELGRYSEFMIVPVGASSFRHALQMGCEVYHTLRNHLLRSYGRRGIAVGDDGAFCPPIHSSSECCDALVEAITQSGYSVQDVKIAIDLSAKTLEKELLQRENLKPKCDEGKEEDAQSLVASYINSLLNGKHKEAILCLEDPFGEDEWASYTNLTAAVASGKDTSGSSSTDNAPLLIIGDNLVSSNANLISEAATKQSCNALLLKPSQCGTISDSIAAALEAESHGWTVMTARRVGETEDDFIADFSVGISSNFIKAGAPARSERLAKYNQLLRIEEMLERNTCSCCGSLNCLCPPGRCGCQPKSGNREFNYSTRYKTHCGSV